MTSRDAQQIAIYMKNFGLSLLGHAIEHAVLRSLGNPDWHAFGVLHAAQAAEIIVKSCIVKDDPVKVLLNPPSSTKTLNLEKLLTEEKTLPYSKLPRTLYEVTGYSIPEIGIYRDFGYLRNMIQHLYIPENKNLPKETLLFVCKVLDPIFQHFWSEGAFSGLITSDDGSVIDFIKVRLEEYGIAYTGWLPDEQHWFKERERKRATLQKWIDEKNSK